MYSNSRVLMNYFNNPPLTVPEIKALSREDREELAALAAKELGMLPTGDPEKPWKPADAK